jgi:amino acid permease
MNNMSIKIDTERFDVVSKYNPSIKSNFKSIFFTMITSTLGLASLYMPKLILETGMILGLAMLAFSALLSYFTCCFLCKASTILEANSYTVLSRKILGKYSFLVDIFYVLNLFGIIIGNQTFVCRTLSGCINAMFFQKSDHNSLTYVMISIITIIGTNLTIIPFIVSRNITNLKRLGRLTILGFSFALGTILATYLVPEFFGFSISPPNLDTMDLVKWEGLRTTSGMYLLSMAIHLVIIDIHSELRPRTANPNLFLVLLNKITCFFLYACISIYGFLTIYQAPKIEKLHNYFLFFLVHQKLEHIILRVAHIVVTLSIMYSNIFCYVPLIKYFNSLINKDSSKIYEQEGSIYQTSPVKKSINSRWTNDIASPKEETLESLSRDLTNDEENDEPSNHFSVSPSVRSSQSFDQVYKKVALSIEMIVVLCLLFLILRQISIFKVFNIISTVCFPIISVIVPAVFYMYAIRNNRSMNFVEYFFAGTFVLIGLVIFILLICNLVYPN